MNSGVFRRQLIRNKEARRLGMFPFPHSFNKINPAFLNYPQEDKYPTIKRTFEEGEGPQLAYQNVRVFPDYYKPYSFNYYGHGWISAYFFIIFLYGYTYQKEIKTVKGRKTLKKYNHDD